MKPTNKKNRKENIVKKVLLGKAQKCILFAYEPVHPKVKKLRKSGSYN